MRWFWSATCISLSDTPITSSGGWYMSIGSCVCMWYICIFMLCVWVCVYNRMCEFVFAALNSQSQPRQTLFSHYWVSFFFFFLLWRIFTGKKQGLSYCIISFHLFIINIEKPEEEEPKWKCTQTYSEIHRLRAAPVLTTHPTLATKKKVQLFWHRCFGHKIPTLLFICIFSLLFSFAHLFLK